MEKKRGISNRVLFTVFGMLLLLVSNTALQAQPIGDVNSNGAVDIVDALLIAKYYIGIIPANFNTAVADVNCSGKIDIVDALLVAQYYVGFGSFSPCSTPVPTAIPNVSFAPDQSVFTDEELLSAAYDGNFKHPPTFYWEDTTGKTIYHENTISITPPAQRGNTWFDLATNSRDEAYNWSVLSNNYSSVPRTYIGELSNNWYFEFSWQDASGITFLSRVYRLSYIDRSMYDRLNPGPIVARFSYPALSSTTVQQYLEYMWFYDNYNIGGRKILSSFVLNDASTSFTIDMYGISVVYGDFGLSDSIQLYKDEYTWTRDTGNATLVRTNIRTITGQQR
jgi:hypothetical protein